MKVVLVACCGKKLISPAPAKDLYQSTLFLKSRRYAERHGDCWLILSAKHGVVDPETIIEPYDETLSRRAASFRREWSNNVARQMAGFKRDRLIVLAGNAYCGWIEGFDFERPMRGLGIGRQLKFLDDGAAGRP